MFRSDFFKKKDNCKVFGFGAQHQNSPIDLAIQAIFYTTRTFMIHVLLYWSERGVVFFCKECSMDLQSGAKYIDWVEINGYALK